MGICSDSGTNCVRIPRELYRHYNPIMTVASPAPPAAETLPQVFRPGGRLADDLRPTRLTPGFVAMPEGSVLVEAGNTRVLCNATIEQGVPSWLRNSLRGGHEALRRAHRHP
jgi:hypothetical protein